MRYRTLVLAISLATVACGTFAQETHTKGLPAIAISRDHEEFAVYFDHGANWACTVYQEQVQTTPDANFPDGQYTPRHCWGLEAGDGQYSDDWKWIQKNKTEWKVWAELTYKDGIRKTNALEVVR